MSLGIAGSDGCEAAGSEEEEEETDSWYGVAGLEMEAEEVVMGRTQAVWSTERQKNAKRRWRARDRHARLR